jgi:hypothetical protein
MARRPMRYPSFYPLLVTGLNTNESLSAEDCGLIAEALELGNANEYFGTYPYERRVALAEIFRAAEVTRLTSKKWTE